MKDYPDLLDFVGDLSSDTIDALNDIDVKLIKWYVRSDGCTKVIDFFIRACIIHDFFYRTHHNFRGEMITRAQADAWFRDEIIRLSRLRLPGRIRVWHLISPVIWWQYVCPLAWWRWCGVRLLAEPAWVGRSSHHA
jgi:hypothetical protein